tara:strand:+ start:397 stop:726 length:330 start_codon:yes stop_codon:yes gene_type:complete
MDNQHTITTAIAVLTDYRAQLKKHLAQVAYNDPEGEGFKIKNAEDLNLCLEEETRLCAQAEKIKEQGASLMHSFQSTPCFQPLPIFISTWTVEEIITHAITHLEYLRDG